MLCHLYIDDKCLSYLFVYYCKNIADFVVFKDYGIFSIVVSNAYTKVYCSLKENYRYYCALKLLRT